LNVGLLRFGSNSIRPACEGNHARRECTKERISQIGEDFFSLTEQETGQVKSIFNADVESIKRSGLSDRTKVRIVLGVGMAIVVVGETLMVGHEQGPCCYGPF
jgi:hypothetical protein